MVDFLFVFEKLFTTLKKFLTEIHTTVSPKTQYHGIPKVGTKYKEGHNRPSSVNLKSLVHKHNKTGNKCYVQDNIDTWESPKCVNR